MTENSPTAPSADHTNPTETLDEGGPVRADASPEDLSAVDAQPSEDHPVGDADATVRTAPLRDDTADGMLQGSPSDAVVATETRAEETTARSDADEAAATSHPNPSDADVAASEPEETGSDAGALEPDVARASASDSNAADAMEPDANEVAASAADASVPDATAADADVPDANAADADVPDANAADADVPDASAADGDVPDANAADADVPDASAADADVPDASAADASAPDDIAADATKEAAPDPVAAANAPAKPAVPNEAFREELEAAVAALQGDDAPPPPRRVKREPPPIPEIPGVPPEQVMKALAAVWKEATDRETPTFKQTLEEGVVRVDVDAVAGYLAVATESDSHRAIGVRRDMVAPLVAALTARTVRDVDQYLAKGPAKIPTASKSAPTG